MATEQECAIALDQLAAQMSKSKEPAAVAAGDRSIACHVTDLDATWIGDLHEGALTGLHRRIADDERPDATLSMTGDDLVALVDGRLKLATAFATGRLRIDASFRDLLRLRSLF
ncbi:MAG: SCP2 sterol-binding domain-containing protein [Mycobacteriales bacterium]